MVTIVCYFQLNNICGLCFIVFEQFWHLNLKISSKRIVVLCVYDFSINVEHTVSQYTAIFTGKRQSIIDLSTFEKTKFYNFY